MEREGREMSTKLQSVEANLGKSQLPEFKVGDHVSVGVLGLPW